MIEFSNRTRSILAGAAILAVLLLLLRIFAPILFASWGSGVGGRFGVAVFACLTGAVVATLCVLSARPDRDPKREQRLQANRRARVARAGGSRRSRTSAAPKRNGER